MKIEERVPETITFRTADRMMYGALGYDGNELMAVISGYDLEIKFNMRLINSLADADACANALADVFYEALMNQLIRENKPFAKPPEAKIPTHLMRLHTRIKVTHSELINQILSAKYSNLIPISLKSPHCST